MAEAKATLQTESPLTTLRRLPRNVWVVTATSFLADVSSEMMIHLLPFFLANVLGAGTAVVGLIEGAAEMTASLLKIFSGWISDRLGARKWPAVLGYTISALSKPFFYVAATWQVVLGVRVAERVGKGIRTAPRDALVADSIDPQHRGLAFGLHRAGDTAGALVGVLIAAGILSASQRGAVALTRPLFQQVVLWSLVPAVLSVVVLAFGAREVAIRPKEAPRFTLRGWDKRFYGFLLTVILFTLGNSSDAFLLLRAQERGLGLVSILLMVASFNLVYTLLAGPAGALSDKIGRRRLIVIGWLVYGLIYLGFALARVGWHIWVLYALYGVYYAMAEGVAKALVADLIPPEKRGTAYGVFNAAIGLTAFPASALAGLLWQGVGTWTGFGPSAPFFFGAGLAFVATVLIWRVLAGMPQTQA